ncbi:MAG TPA: hypothetical protein VFW96_24675 [Thermomicrobiales bacterium]|nr:hypothetical protein [Thermomicrobiales bacterium]
MPRHTPLPPRPPPTCVACQRARAAARPALVARLALRSRSYTLWLCRDCAEDRARVLDFVAAYEALRDRLAAVPGRGGGAARPPAEDDRRGR